MKTMMVALLFFFFPSWMFASSESQYPLEKMVPDLNNKASLQRGMQTFMNHCFGCHSMQYQRYGRVADDLGIPYDLMEENLIFTESKINNLMINGMDKEEGKAWFGVAPPDLTLMARAHGTDWLYTYLRTFYFDPKQTWGADNKAFPSVGMPNVLEPLQGRQLEVCKGEGEHKTCALVIDPEHKGSMNKEEFDHLVYDLVNFMAYSGEPMKMERQHIGIYVLLFLLIFLVFAYLLKREYWKEVH